MSKRILIEFFDRDSLENVVPLTGGAYEEAVYLYFPQLNEPEPEEKRVLEFFVKKRFQIPVRFCGVPEQTVGAVGRALNEIVEAENDYEIDLTGGSELFCAAVGCYMARRSQSNVALQQFDVRRGRRVFRYPDEDAPIRTLNLSVREVVALHRAAVLKEMPGIGIEQLDADMEREILRLWDAVKDIPRQWNNFCTLSGFTPAEYRSRQEKCVHASGQEATYQIVAERLRKSGILTNEERMCIEGKDYQIFDLNVPVQAQVLYQKAGNLLELYCALGAVKAGCFHDGQVSVMLDWDREDGNSADDVRNEVDVVLTCGHIPIFISCKNTQIENEYLYEIKTMARRFGGRYAVPAIVSTARHKKPIRDRAREMGVVLIDEVNRLTLHQFAQRLQQFFQPRG